MKTLQIDFAPRASWWQAGSDARRRPLWYVLCALLLLALGFVSVSAWQLEREKSQALSRRALVQAELDRAAQGDEAVDTARLESAEAIAHASLHLNYPWARLISSLEKSMRPEVSVLSMEFGLVRQSNKLVVESSDLGMGMDYIEALKAEPGFTGMALMRQESVTVDGGQRIRFTLEAPQPVSAPKTVRADGRPS